MGIDFAQYEPDQPLDYIETNALRSLIEGFTVADSNRKWLMKDPAKYMGMGIGPVIVGDPIQVADELQTWVDAGAHEFNLACSVRPGTMREKLFGHHRLQAPHPAVKFRPGAELGAKANKN